MNETTHSVGTINDDLRWETVTRRDTQAMYEFLYAVRTTGIYCRPGCRSRLPERKNVQFFDSSLDAESAGFRACKRCSPRSPILEDTRVALVRHACRSIESSEDTLSLAEISASVGLSPSRFHRVFKELTGSTPKEYAEAIKASRMREKLHSGSSVTQSLHASGYSSSSRFYEKWAWMLGMKPSVYGSGGSGELILFSTVDTHLGAMLIAATRVGVCAIAFGEHEELERELRDQFHKATIVEGDSEYRSWVEGVVGCIKTPRGFRDLPLDIQGTAFMRRVWSAICDIPSGQTRAYRDIAESIGEPAATRAVASACGKNSLAVAIPCHRVVRSDGGLGGYRWGTKRKKALLDGEATQTELNVVHYKDH